MRRLLLAAGLAVAATPALSVTLHGTQASWDAALDSTYSVPLPDAGAQPGPYTVGDITFSRGSPSATELYFGGPVDWSSLIAGHDIAVSGTEDVIFDFARAINGVSFLLHEPSANTGLTPDSCNAVCSDTTFAFELFSGATSLGSVSLNPADDTAVFVGLTDSTGFDRLVISDLTGTIDNEFFGQIQLGTIPLPAALPLLAGALLAGGAFTRRGRFGG